MNKYIDLHLHLDGAISVNIAKRLADLQNISLPFTNDEELKKAISIQPDCKSLSDFLRCFAFPLSLMQTKIGISNAVKLVLEEMKNNGVIYAEIRYAPQLHCEKGLTQEEVILASLEGLKQSPIKANLILCCMRGEGNEKQNDLTVELAKKYLVIDDGVVAIDLAGAEDIYPTIKYKNLFAKAKSLGIPFTIHAGESEGPESVKQAIEYGASRIGHGVRCQEDKRVYEIVKKSGVTLELCPTSNLLTQSVKDINEYPLKRFLNDGIKVTINTDDPAIEGVNINHEVNLLKEKLNLSDKELKEIFKNSIDSAFTNQETRNWLYKEMFDI